jgi:hypothetical protein
MPILYRSMIEDTDGKPEVSPTARGLGVRAGRDVAAIDKDDLVFPGGGGMSVSPDSPMNLPSY